MCGIFFLGDLNKENCLFDKKKINKSISYLKLRGPDFSKIDYHSNFVIAHTRLSIIDLTNKSNQPFYDITKNYILSFNGEIYNYIELKKKLQKFNIRFKSNSDTEILLYCLIYFGINETLNIIEGMFAFIFVDKEKKQIYAARDKFGQKPIYYYFKKNKLIISSSINSILENVGSPSFDEKSMILFLNPAGNQGTRGLFTEQTTFFKNIKSLSAGEVIKFNRYSKKKIKYFDIKKLFSLDQYNRNKEKSEEKLLSDLAELFHSSISYHSISDVNNGIFLSGGIDSSLIHYFSKKIKKNLYSFTKISPNIESIPLKIVPKLINNNKKSFFIEQNQNNFVKNFIDLIKFGASPIRWGGAPSMYSLSNFAKNKNVKVLLGGDCFDELFMGYKHYDPRFYNNRNKLSELIKSENRFKKTNVNSIINQHNYNQSKFNSELNYSLKYIKNKFEKNAISYSIQDIHYFLQTIVLPNSDLYSMMASVELRNPALFSKLVEFSINLPISFKLKSNFEKNNKYLLRKLAIKKMDKSINVKKEGTRNFALQVSDNKYWKYNKFNVFDLIKYNGEFESRDLFRILNLEAFINLYSGISKDSFLEKNLTELGKKDLL